jgi:hypothetical protein
MSDINLVKNGDTPMTNAIKNELETITNVITANTQTAAIYLSGSYAYGQPYGDSKFCLILLTNSLISL